MLTNFFILEVTFSQITNVLFIWCDRQGQVWVLNRKMGLKKLEIGLKRKVDLKNEELRTFWESKTPISPTILFFMISAFLTQNCSTPSLKEWLSINLYKIGLVRELLHKNCDSIITFQLFPTAQPKFKFLIQSKWNFPHYLRLTNQRLANKQELHSSFQWMDPPNNVLC